ncbi:MAG TPA: hypothetical protein VMG60_23145 [Burkholderiaceae bacterium]|nr:hypothetical protein [Burkholderiaceae bacterium]
MNEPRNTLDDWLAAARADLAQRSPPGWIEPAITARQSEGLLLRRLRPGPPAKPPRVRSRWWWSVPVGVATILVVPAGVLVLANGGAPPFARARAPAFMALTPIEAIAAEPRPLVIASEVPRAQLAAIGLPVDPARADQPVRAEFLVSQRGAVLAVRFSPE